MEWQAPAGGGSALTFITSATPSTAASQSFDNCFSATYQNYLCVLNVISSGDDQELYYRLRASGSDASGSNYDFQFMGANGTTVSGYREASSNYARVGTVDDANQAGYTFYVFRPFSATPTATLSSGAVPHNPIRVQTTAGAHSLSTSYDGITFYPAGGTITGTIRIYGIANS